MHTSSKPNVPASLAKGLTLHRQGRIEAARKYYLRILDTQTDHPDVLHLLGLVEYDAVNVDRAIDLIQSAIKADPKRADFFLSLGRAFEKKGRSNQAIASFKKALAIDPAMSRASLNLATQYLNCGRTGDAVHCLQQAVNTVPDCVDAHLMIGQVHLDRGHLDAAIRRWERRYDPGP